MVVSAVNCSAMCCSGCLGADSSVGRASNPHVASSSSVSRVADNALLGRQCVVGRGVVRLCVLCCSRRAVAAAAASQCWGGMHERERYMSLVPGWAQLNLLITFS